MLSKLYGVRACSACYTAYERFKTVRAVSEPGSRTLSCCSASSTCLPPPASSAYSQLRGCARRRAAATLPAPRSPASAPAWDSVVQNFTMHKSCKSMQLISNEDHDEHEYTQTNQSGCDLSVVSTKASLRRIDSNGIVCLIYEIPMHSQSIYNKVVYSPPADTSSLQLPSMGSRDCSTRPPPRTLCGSTASSVPCCPHNRGNTRMLSLRPSLLLHHLLCVHCRACWRGSALQNQWHLHIYHVCHFMRCNKCMP